MGRRCRLRNRLRIQLALSIRARGEYICKLEERLKAAHEQLTRDVAHFNETVENQLQTLIGAQ